MRMNERTKKALSALLCASMLARNAPVVAFASQEDCTHHAEHTQECGYGAAVEGKPCTHSHDTAVCGYVEEVKEELCDCAETDENGALVHTEGCGYVAPVAGSDCTHGHDASCGYVEAVTGQPCTYRCEICLGSGDEEEEEEEQETTAPSEPENTEAAEEVVPVEPIELHQTVARTMELDAPDFDNDEAFAAYVERLFYGDSGISTFGPLVGNRLTGANKKVYDNLKNQITAVAAGTQSSTVFSVSTEEMGITVTVTENELEGDLYVVQDGVASFTAEAQNALIDKFWDAVNLQLIQKALSSDCPYDLYWLDKSVNTGLSFNMGLAQDEAGNMYGLITELTMIMYVSRDYQGEDATTVDSSKPAIAAQAAATARRIAAAANNADKSDYEKLMVYKNYICNAASYNVEAVKNDYERGYGDPWQMIYVFDDNPNTKVVCEGYSKALQYLCDQSGVSCISVGGSCVSEDENGGPHMWNIVTLKGENDQEGKNYLVDLTNSDTDTVGQNGELFLAGSDVGSAAEGYIFPTAAGNMGYFYDDLTLSTWETADLTLAEKNYHPVPETPEVSECNHSGSTHNAVTDNKDGTHSFTCTVCGNNVTEDCSVITEAPEPKTLTFNGQDQELITAGTATIGTVKYRLSQIDSFSAAIPTGKNAGTYTVYYMVEGDTNHKDISESSVEVTIDKAVANVEDIPVQKHFRTYAASNSLDLSGFLPQNRGETTYTLGTVTGNFFEAGTAVTDGVLNYATNEDGTDTAGSIQVNVVMENYEDVTLTVNVERVELTAETKHQVAKNELTEVPTGLTGTAFNTVEAIKAAQHSMLTRLLKEDPKDNVIHYDMKLQFSPDGGNSWVDAAHRDFPTKTGVTVTLPYPTGTGRYTHNFAVSHMFTTVGTAGTVETPEITYTDSGIEFKLTGMSPVSVGWTAKQFNVAVANSSHGKVTVSHTSAPAGTQVTIKVTPDSGYRMSTLTVTDDAGNSCILGLVNDDTYIFTMPAANVTVKATFVSNSTAVADTTNPKTGDDFHMAFWGGMMMTTMLGVAALLLSRKKFLQK